MRQTVSEECEKLIQSQRHRESSHPNSNHGDAVLGMVLAQPFGDLTSVPQGRESQEPRGMQWLSGVLAAHQSSSHCIAPRGEINKVVGGGREIVAVHPGTHFFVTGH